MTRVKDEGHFSSWIGLAPSKDISSGRIVGRGKKKVKNRVAVVLHHAVGERPALAQAATLRQPTKTKKLRAIPVSARSSFWRASRRARGGM
jgi:hypothetical protein